MSIIDVHSHFVPEFVYEELAAGGSKHGLKGDQRFIESAAGPLPIHAAELRTVEAKLAAMDERGVDEAVISLTPHLFLYAPEHDPVEFARRANDALAQFVAGSPRLHGLATLPLAHPQEAAAELRRAVVELGLRGAIVGTGLSHEWPLDTLEPQELFSAAEELDVPLMLHPGYCGVVTEQEFFLNNSLGVPFDTAWAVTRLLVSGAVDGHPRLRFLLPHGGGSLLSVLGRLDNAYERRPGLKERAKGRPSEYLRQLWFDSIVHDPEALAILARRVGPDRVLLGTDAPYLTGDERPLESFAAAGLDAGLAGAAARNFFGLPSGPSLPDDAARLGAEPHHGGTRLGDGASPGHLGALAAEEVRVAVIRGESELLSPAGRQDEARLEDLIHPDFDEIGRTGFSWERPDVIRVLQTVPHQTRSVEFGRVISLGPGVAHVRFRTEDDRGVVHRSSIWVQDELGTWRQRYHQGTPDTQDS